MSLAPRHVVVGIVNVQPARSGGARGGRIGKPPQTLAGHLSSVRALAARQLSGVARRVAIDGETTVAVRPPGGVGRMPFRGGGGVAPAVAQLSLFVGE